MDKTSVCVCEPASLCVCVWKPGTVINNDRKLSPGVQQLIQWKICLDFGFLRFTTSRRERKEKRKKATAEETVFTQT